MKERTFTSLILLGLLISSGCVRLNVSLFDTKRTELEVKKLVDAKNWSRNKILLLDLTGFIDSSSDKSTLVTLKDRLDRAEEMKRLKGIILRINSPGGSVTASSVIHRELLEFKRRMSEKNGKSFPLYVLMEDVAASGGVYAAMAADRIYALPTTTTGSIGVIATWPKWKGLTEKIGLDMHLIKSADKKDMGSPWRELTKEEQAIFQRLIDGMYHQFIEVVLAAREQHGLTREALLSFADGRVFLSKEAVALKLIDEIQFLPEVIEAMKTRIGDPGAAVIALEYEGHYRGNVYATGGVPNNAGFGKGEVNLLKVDAGVLGLPGKHAQFLYMWMPGE